MKKEIVDHFEMTSKEYDAWYDMHAALYQSELDALRKAVPPGRGLEIGVGTGRFAAPLGVRCGLDPSFKMLEFARKRGLLVVQGTGEDLPFKSESFDFVQIVFVIEFIDDPGLFIGEAVRTLKRRGSLILGFIDRDSAWGRYYTGEASHRKNFHPPGTMQLLEIMDKSGLEFAEAYQTLVQPPPDISRKEEPSRGYGERGFVVFKSIKR